jgi:hypothetical protein
LPDPEEIPRDRNAISSVDGDIMEQKVVKERYGEQNPKKKLTGGPNEQSPLAQKHVSMG